MSSISSATLDTPPSDWPSAIELRPFDEANARLLQTVVPRSWVNPVPKGRYHLVVIGVGTAGLVSAAIAKGLGARSTRRASHVRRELPELRMRVPSKAAIRSARALA